MIPTMYPLWTYWHSKDVCIFHCLVSFDSGEWKPKVLAISQKRNCIFKLCVYLVITTYLLIILYNYLLCTYIIIYVVCLYIIIHKNWYEVRRYLCYKMHCMIIILCTYYVCRYIIVGITGIKYLSNMLYYSTETSRLFQPAARIIADKLNLI